MLAKRELTIEELLFFSLIVIIAISVIFTESNLAYLFGFILVILLIVGLISK